MRTSVAIAVFAGMALAVVASVTSTTPAAGSLPGVALDSPTLLLVERVVAFFLAWLVLLVVSAQALRGRLPIEISGRGLRYADAERAQHGVAATERALARVDAEMDAIHARIGELEGQMVDGNQKGV